MAVEASSRERKSYFGIFGTPNLVLHRSVKVLTMLVEYLDRLRRIADETLGRFHSEAFQAFFAMLAATGRRLLLTRCASMSGDCSSRAGAHRRRLDKAIREWTTVCAARTRVAPAARGPARPRLRVSFRVHERDEAGARASRNAGRGINHVANAAGQSVDHILAFSAVRTELAFYLGCLNLHERLSAKGGPVCFPRRSSRDGGTRSEGLYDVPFAQLPGRVVGNSFDAAGKHLVLVTGPNQGGKSTFVRSMGLAQLMMQAGMYVPARSCTPT